MLLPPEMGLDFAMLLPISSLGGGVAGLCRWLSHLRFVTVGGLRGEQQPYLHCNDYSAESSCPSPHILPSVAALCYAAVCGGLALVPAAAFPHPPNPRSLSPARRTLAAFLFTLCVCFAL